MFINFSNHPSSQWCDAQRAAALCYGPLQDFKFPAVSPTVTSAALSAMAQEYAAQIIALQPAAVLCQGEQSLCFAVIDRLLSQGIPVFCACSVRSVTEHQNAQGQTEKCSVFEFVQFRAYTR